MRRRHTVVGLCICVSVYLYVCNSHFLKVAKNQALANAVQAQRDNILWRWLVAGKLTELLTLNQRLLKRQRLYFYNHYITNCTNNTYMNNTYTHEWSLCHISPHRLSLFGGRISVPVLVRVMIGLRGYVRGWSFGTDEEDSKVLGSGELSSMCTKWLRFLLTCPDGVSSGRGDWDRTLCRLS